MGIDTAVAKFLCAAKSMGADFTKMAMIGRQGFGPDPVSLQRIFAVLGSSLDAGTFLRDNKWGEPFFTLLGAKEIVSVDVSSFEGATHLHDMNQPIPDDLRGRFSLVCDLGTLEHIFNIYQALKNCMEMVQVGGQFLQVNHANNFMGHGFWQLSPEMIFRAFSPENGYRVDVVLLHEVVRGGAWYVVRDPDQVHQRVELCNRRPTYILTLATRVAEAEIFASPPQQSDYVVAWNTNADLSQGSPAPSSQTTQHPSGIKRLIPRPLRRVLRANLNRLRRVPEFQPSCYSRIQEDALLHGKVDIKPYKTDTLSVGR